MLVFEKVLNESSISSRGDAVDDILQRAVGRLYFAVCLKQELEAVKTYSQYGLMYGQRWIALFTVGIRIRPSAKEIFEGLRLICSCCIMECSEAVVCFEVHGQAYAVMPFEANFQSTQTCS